MIDLTPLDVRKKLGDFGKGLRGYDPQEVDTFIELVAERMEALVKENLQLRDRGDHLEGRVSEQEGREKAIQEALVTAQTLREDVKQQAQREGELLRREAQADAERVLESAHSDAQRIMSEAQSRAAHLVSDATQALGDRRAVLEELERRRHKLLKGLRTLLEREMDAVEVEEGRPDLDLSGLSIVEGVDSSITPISSVPEASGLAPAAEDPIGGEENGAAFELVEGDAVVTPIDEAPSFSEGATEVEMMEGTSNVIGVDEAGAADPEEIVDAGVGPDQEAGAMEDVATGVPTLDEILDEAGDVAGLVEDEPSTDDDDAETEDEESTGTASSTDSLWLSALRRDQPEADQET